MPYFPPPATSTSGSFTMTTVEIDLGTTPKKAGKFQITGLSGLTPGKVVLVQQAALPYTGKGTLSDESEMDIISVDGVVLDSTTIQCYWTCSTFIKGNVKLNYVVSA